MATGKNFLFHNQSDMIQYQGYSGLSIVITLVLAQRFRIDIAFYFVPVEKVPGQEDGFVVGIHQNAVAQSASKKFPGYP